MVARAKARVSEGSVMHASGIDLLGFAGSRRFATVLADPPWQFTNKTGKVAPEHKRLSRYGTMKLEDIAALPVDEIATSPEHLYLWRPNAMLPEGVGPNESLGVHLQIQYRLAQDPQGRWL